MSLSPTSFYSQVIPLSWELALAISLCPNEFNSVNTTWQNFILRVTCAHSQLGCFVHGHSYLSHLMIGLCQQGSALEDNSEALVKPECSIAKCYMSNLLCQFVNCTSFQKIFVAKQGTGNHL